MLGATCSTGQRSFWFEIRSAWAVTADELVYQLNAFKPNIIHFVGHGDMQGEIVLEDKSGLSRPVSPEALGGVFANFRQWLQIVVLNACYSAVQVQSLVKQVDAVIGMREAISDHAAIEFSASLYRAIGFGRTVQDAFDQAVAVLRVGGLPGDRTPAITGRESTPRSLPSLEYLTSLSLSGAPRTCECRNCSERCSGTDPSSL